MKEVRLMGLRKLLCAASALALTSMGMAQTAPLFEQFADVQLDSGQVVNDGDERGVIYSDVIAVDDALWTRLYFEDVTLGQTTKGGEPTVLRLTSMYDDAVQHHTATTIQQWQWTSAYFNGGRVRVELIADPGAQPSRVKVNFAMTQPGGADLPDVERTICGPTDDRVLSEDPRQGRLVPIGCTAWLIDDANHCFLTAGHCIGTGGSGTMEFNVPLSTGGGSIVHPGPEDQYAVDSSSAQSTGSGGVGNDAAYFGCFPNTETGLTPFEAQGDFYVLADVAPPVSGQDIRITGYGTTSSPAPPQWNQVQKTHDGPYASQTGNAISYSTDTTGGNSGSPVEDVSTGLAIGIHTHGGCSSGGGANNGSAIHHPSLQEFLANPLGVCIPNDLDFIYPSGRPDTIDPAGGAAFVVVVEGLDSDPVSDSGVLHYSVNGGPFQSVPMQQTLPHSYEAIFPAIACGADVSYYITVDTTDGETIADPRDAPATGTFSAVATLGFEDVFVDDFETDNGWTVSGDALDGAWERGVPLGGGDRGDPALDADGSGQCFVTDLADENSDVDDGQTTLLSPMLDTTGGNTVARYWRWYHNSFGAAPFTDVFVVEVSDDNGASWMTLETVGPDGPQVSGGWNFVQHDLMNVDGFTPSTTTRIRFIAEDAEPGSVVEAGVDGFHLSAQICSSDECPADFNNNGAVDTEDLLSMLSAWGSCPGCVEDLTGNEIVDTEDLLQLLGTWGPCDG